jgi:crotonobetaine/carnitine-CoA ligase
VSETVLPTLLARRAAEEPDRVFLRYSGGEDWTYAQLDERVLAWAATLAACGVVAGDRVLLMLPNALDAVALWLAVARLGAIEVPVNTGYRGRFLEHAIRNSGPRCAVVAPEFFPRFEELGDLCPPLLGTEEPLAGPLPELVEPAVHDVSTIVYTSGTTGPSKGVIVPWGQAYVMSTGFFPMRDLEPEDVWYSPYPLFHMSGKAAVYGMAVAGGQVLLRERFSTGEFWSDVDTYGCTMAFLIGAVPVFLASQPPRPDDADHPLCKVVLAPPPDDPRAFCARFGVRATTVFNMTEIACPIVADWDLELLERGSFGRVRPGFEVRIVDEHDRPLPPGEVGEIVVRADEPWTLMAGYWGMPAETAAAWRNLWFHTGDLGKLDPDGAFYFLDRSKDAIRRRGENISSMELEAEINEFALVAESAVIGVPSELGEEDVKAFVVPTDAARFSPEALIEFLVERVPAFMVPRYVVVVDSLPKTPTEKVRKVELREMPVDARTWERPAVRAG